MLPKIAQPETSHRESGSHTLRPEPHGASGANEMSQFAIRIPISVAGDSGISRVECVSTIPSSSRALGHMDSEQR